MRVVWCAEKKSHEEDRVKASAWKTLAAWMFSLIILGAWGVSAVLALAGVMLCYEDNCQSPLIYRVVLSVLFVMVEAAFTYGLNRIWGSMMNGIFDEDAP